MKIKQIKETCLYVSDLEHTIDFYEGKLGLKCFTHAKGRHAFFQAGESVLLCFNPEDSRYKSHLPPHYGYGHLHFAFLVAEDEYEAWKERVVEGGIEITHEEEWGGGKHSFYFDDPDGHCVEIMGGDIWV